ncbi:DUF2171 domain-containing protein [Sphingomonas tagetis]|uniref:DUF2171 domain-containing protein n=1 Tax=Sphingomonas tagetis TaxID=2949092 RepID=UPI00345E2E70
MEPRDIKPHMEVFGADGVRIGTVDHLDGDRIKLSREGSRDGEHHYVPLSTVGRVDAHVHLTLTAASLPAGTAAAAGCGTAGAIPPIRNPAVGGSHPRRNYYLPWVLLALALLALLLLATKGCTDADRREPVATADRTATAPLAVESVKLPNGKSVDLQPNTLNYALQRYLASDEPTPRAFTFDNLNFETASAAIRPQDAGTIETLAQILRAYPDAHGRVVGYTDARGSAASNTALGELRAQAVMAALVEKGVNKRRLEAGSAGEGAPVSSNRTREGQSENRRTEFVVMRK